MGSLIRSALVISFFWALAGGPFKILGASSAQALLDGQVLVDDYTGDDYWLAGKRSGFWSPHPSDYNPMRRPNPLVRPNSKRDSDENPYHPLAKVLNYHKHRNGVPEEYPDAVIDSFELPVHKRHIWPANLMFRLGQGSPSSQVVAASNRKPKYVPSEPQSSSA